MPCPSNTTPAARRCTTRSGRTTLFQSRHNYSPLQLAVEGARLAYYRVEQSESEKRASPRLWRASAFGGLALFADAATGTEAFAARRDDGTTMLSFRGTQPDDVTDLATDLRANTVAWPESAGRAHAGFAAAARALMPQIQQWMAATSCDPARMIVTGHSLGAALATLAGRCCVRVFWWHWARHQWAMRTSRARWLRRTSCVSWTAVTLSPKCRRRSAATSTCMRACTSHASARSSRTRPQPLVDADRQRARLDYLTQYAWRTGSVLVRDLADHAPINYARAVFP